jgi:putative transposase
VTALRKHHHEVVANQINQDTNPEKPNQVEAGNVIYLRMHQGWMYLTIVIDLYSRKTIGWAMDKRMTTKLVERMM